MSNVTFPYDDQIAAAAAAAPSTVVDVIRTMETMDAVLPDGDGLKWFNWLYLNVTRAVASRVAGAGFHDPAWMADLDVRFAGLYFSALRDWLGSTSAPGCWSALFANRGNDAIARIQFALAGMNAHINHDLCAAVAATCAAFDTPPIWGDFHYADYTYLNATLDSLIATAKQQLMVRLLGEALPPVNNLENTIAAWSVAAAREAAWTNAEILWRLQPDPQFETRYMKFLDGITAVAGKALLVPVPRDVVISS
jgi:Family of unknown function (DUF5995)